MTKRACFYALVILTVFWCAGPVLWQFLTSIKADAELTRIPPILPSRPVWQHYEAIFEERLMLRLILNSTFVAACTTLLSVSLGSLCAFAIALLRLRWKMLLLGLVLSVSMFPPIATVSPLYIIIRAAQMRDTWWALIATYTTFSLPLSIWILTNFFRQVPHEIYWAARIDGCTPLQAFRRILLPLSAPGIAAAAILVFIFSWNEFLFALTFTATTASRTIPVGIALFPGIHEVPWGEISAASIVATIPLFILVLLFQRRIIEGLTAGSIKG